MAFQIADYMHVTIFTDVSMGTLAYDLTTCFFDSLLQEFEPFYAPRLHSKKTSMVTDFNCK